MLVFVFFFGCLSQTESKNTEEFLGKITVLFERRSRYTLPIEKDFPQSVVETLQSCSTSICYVDIFAPSQEMPSERSNLNEYYFLHSGNFALLIKSSNNRALSRTPVLRWHRVNGILSYCLGDLLQYQSLGLNIDREISIELIDNRYKWIIEFNGDNICELSGILKVGIFDESIDTTGLVVDSKPWTRGGSVYLHEKMLHMGIEILDGKTDLPF